MAPSVSTLASMPAYRYDHVREAACGDAAPVEAPVPLRAPRYGGGASCHAPPSPPTRPLPLPPTPPPSADAAAEATRPPSPPSTLLPSPRPLRSVASEASLDTLSLRMASLRRSAAAAAAAGGAAGAAAAAGRAGAGAAASVVTRELAVVGRLYGAAVAAAARRAASTGVGCGGGGVGGGGGDGAAPAAAPPPGRLAAAVGLPACAAAALPPLPTFVDFCAYYDDRLRGADAERRLYQVLRGDAAKVPVAAVAATVRALLSARGSPLYERNARIAVETVLYGLHADPLVTVYTATDLAGPRLAASLAAAETTGVLTGALAALAPGRFAGMLMDWTDLLEDAGPGVECSCPAAAAAAVAAEAAAEAAAARERSMPDSWASSVSLAEDAAVAGDALRVPGRDGGGIVDDADMPLCASPPPMSVISASSSADSHLSVPEPACSPHTLSCEYHSGRGGGGGAAASRPAAAADGPAAADDGDTWVCGGSLNAFCEAKGLLTPRAVATVVRLYGRHGRLSSAGFCRLFQALTTCGAVGSAVGYWFRVLDHDLDGVIGAGDVRHYYAHKRVLGHAAEPDVVLTCVRHVWTRLVAMAGGRTSGLRPRDLRVLTDKEREFVLCALLVRRVDDGGLVNVRATLRLTSDVDDGSPLGVVS